MITLGLWVAKIGFSVTRGFLRIRNLYNNFLLHIHVVQFLFYIFVLPVQFFLSLTF